MGEKSYTQRCLKDVELNKVVRLILDGGGQEPGNKFCKSIKIRGCHHVISM